MRSPGAISMSTRRHHRSISDDRRVFRFFAGWDKRQEGVAITGLLLQGEVKDNTSRELPRQPEAMYARAADTYLKSDAATGKRYIDLNAAMQSYRGAWLYGSQHVQVFVNRMKAQWEQFCPVPADIPDGVLMRGNVLYRTASGGWQRSPDQFEGVLKTKHGFHGGRYFIGRTQHTFQGRNLPGGRLTVVGQLDICLSHTAPANPLVSVNSPPGGGQSYRQSESSYSAPALSYPTYESGYDPYAPSGSAPQQ